MNEVLNPDLKDISNMFTDELRGMTSLEVTLDQLNQARNELISTIKEVLDIYVSFP